jgi:NAD(P)-dependent dehydrogenase (short-subunit alcohol dehydrogenase family)
VVGVIAFIVSGGWRIAAVEEDRMSEGRSVIVTGAAGGIGRATAERLARGGWRVLAVDRDAGKLAWAEGRPGIASAVADVSSEADNQRIVAEAERLHGRLDAVVLNAAITGGGRIDELPWEDFQRVIAVNLCGPVLGVRAALPALRRQGGGAIAVTSSTMGVAGDAENFAYCMAKHALIGLVRSVSREIGWENIRINALCPGPTKTAMTGMMEDVAPAHFERLARSVPLQRWADPDEMASVLEFLISPAASYVSGHALVADGGAMVGTGLTMPSSGDGRAIPEQINH